MVIVDTSVASHLAKSSTTDLLNDDYTTKFTLKSKQSAGPVAVTLETDWGKDGALTSKVGTKFSYAKFNVDKGQIKPDGGKVIETSMKLAPDVKLSFKADKGADLGIDYTKGNFYATGVLDVVDMSKFSTSACVSLPSGLKVGGDLAYALSGSTGVTGFTVGASYTAGPLFTSLTANNKNQFGIGLLYKVNNDLSIGSMTTHSSAKTCTVLGLGGTYKAPEIGTIKAKFDGNGLVSASLIREIAPKVTLTASGSVQASDLSTFKPGFTISM